jgi:PAS domain-containing protein
MGSANVRHQNAEWLAENGPRELELLLRVVLYHSSQPILVADNDRRCLDSSFGASKLLRLSRDQLITRRMESS